MWHLIAAGAVGGWIGLVGIAAQAGVLEMQGARLTMFAVPVVILLAGAVLSREFRAALLSIPTPLLIGLNAARVFGFLFLLLASEGRLSGPFPEFAAWGDMITGAFAMPVAWLAAQRSSASARYVIAWNAFGTLDLINALLLAVLSTNGSVFQLIHAGAGASAMATFPWALVPAFLVPFYLLTHAIVFAQTRGELRPVTLLN